jgi:hypothetical protein
MAEPDHPMAIAMQWVSRVFAASLMMVAPGLGGQGLDGRWGTAFLGPLGFGGGLVGGVAYLIAITRQADVARRRKAGERGELVPDQDGRAQREDGPK